MAISRINFTKLPVISTKLINACIKCLSNFQLVVHSFLQELCMMLVGNRLALGHSKLALEHNKVASERKK